MGVEVVGSWVRGGFEGAAVVLVQQAQEGDTVRQAWAAPTNKQIFIYLARSAFHCLQNTTADKIPLLTKYYC